MIISKLIISLCLLLIVNSFEPKTIYSRADPRWAEESFLGDPNTKLKDKQDIVKLDLNTCVVTLLATSVNQRGTQCIDRECNPSQLNYLLIHNLIEINYLLNIKEMDVITGFNDSILPLIASQIDQNVHWMFLTKPIKKNTNSFFAEYYNDIGLITHIQPTPDNKGAITYVDSLGKQDKIYLDQVEALMFIVYNHKHK
jgi:hypothetical protein